MKRNDSRAIARLKRMYREFKDNLFVKDGKKWRPCESITEFLELKWVKKLKNTGSIERHHWTNQMLSKRIEKKDIPKRNRFKKEQKNTILDMTRLVVTVNFLRHLNVKTQYTKTTIFAKTLEIKQLFENFRDWHLVM